ncbi:MAG: TetR/AcrR family transcriptional regulator [Myxococcota bacterium]
MSKPKRPDDRRRDQILRCALTCFSRDGRKGTSLRRVAREAGVSLGCVQHYFQTRQQLDDAVMAFAIRNLTAEGHALFELPDAAFGPLLHAAMAAQVRWGRDHPEVSRLGARLAMDEPDHQWPGEEEVHAEVRRRIRHGQEQGDLRDFDPQLLLVLFEILVNGWTQYREHYARLLPHVDDDQRDTLFVAFAADVILRGINRDAPRPSASRR